MSQFFSLRAGLALVTISLLSHSGRLLGHAGWSVTVRALA